MTYYSWIRRYLAIPSRMRLEAPTILPIIMPSCPSVSPPPQSLTALSTMAHLFGFSSPWLTPPPLHVSPGPLTPGMASILMSAVGLGVRFTSAPLPHPSSAPPPPSSSSRPAGSKSRSSVRREKRQHRTGSYATHPPPTPPLWACIQLCALSHPMLSIVLSSWIIPNKL